MPFHLQGDDHTTVITLSGIITEAEIAVLGQALHEQEAKFPLTPNRLTDLSAMEQGYFPTATLERLAREGQKVVYPHKFKSAIVAPHPLEYGLSRMFQIIGEHPQIDLQIFKTRAEADAWLKPRA